MHVARLRQLALVGALLLAPTLLAAQTGGPRPFRVGAAAGGSLPLGDFGDVAKFGFHVGGLVEFQPVNFPVALRGEVTYHRYEVENLDDANWRTWAFTGNVVLPLGAGTETASPYLIAGAGVYNNGVNIDGGDDEDFDDSSTDFGLNGGIGLRLPLTGFTALIEARFHTVFTEDKNTNFIPFSFGIVF